MVRIAAREVYSQITTCGVEGGSVRATQHPQKSGTAARAIIDIDGTIITGWVNAVDGEEKV